jgi:quaternary ammonium compound-resistance protein SugE
MNWIILIIAGFSKWDLPPVSVKQKPLPAILPFCGSLDFLSASRSVCIFLYKATQTLPMGTAYAVWTGIGAVGTVIIGIIFFKEPADFWRLFFIVTLIASIVGLKMVSAH